MSNPFMKKEVSLEDLAAFSDELTKDATAKEEHYLKGFSSDTPEIVEENKIQDDAAAIVEQTLGNLDDTMNSVVTTESTIGVEPELNPFFNTVAGEHPEEVDITGDEKSDLTSPPVSLESIIEDLEEVMTENKPNARSTEFLVDVHLDDNSKVLLDQDIDAIISTEPEVFESLESIKLCGERSIPAILSILRNKLDEIKSI